MTRIISNKLIENIDQEVTVKGWLHNVRKLGNIAFLILRDRGGLAQIVLSSADEITKLDNIYTGSVLEVTGKCVSSPKSKYGCEIQDGVVTVLNPVKFPSPIDISKEDLNVELDTLLDWKVVTARHPKESAIFKVSANSMRAMRESCYELDFTEMSTAKLEGFPAEGGADCFELEYFGKTVYLAQSPQLYKQMMCGVYERVFEIGRYYRAEKSNTSRHMSEINMFDIEMVFLKDHSELLDVVETLFKNIVSKTVGYSKKEMELLGVPAPVLSEKIPRITCADLHELYLKETGKDFRSSTDVEREEEPFICDYAMKNWGSEAVFVTEFPWSSAKFYHHRSETNPDIADRADLLFRGVEIATVPLREVRYDKLIEQMAEKGVDSSNPGLKAYLDSFKYGMPEMQGGFGFGVARFVQKILNMANAKEAELFPRDVNRVAP